MVRRTWLVAGTGLLMIAFGSASSPSLAEETGNSEPELSGDDIYHRILDNRFSAYIQELHMTSGDRGGNALRTEINMRYKNYRDEGKRTTSKTIAKYLSPQDVRHLGYLVINKTNGRNDEFIYQPSSRKVKRMNLRGEAVFGTDFSFEDIIPQEFEDGSHTRLPDSVVSGVETYVVEVIPTEKADSEYSKFVVQVEKKHYVPLQTDYWDNKDIHIKTLVVDPESLKGFEDEDKDGPKTVWVATEQKVTQLKMETWTSLEIVSLEARPKLRNKDFSQRELTSGR